MFIPLAYQLWKTLKAVCNQRVSSKYRVEPESIKSNDNDILSTTRNTLILRYFIQLACTNLNGSHKEWVNFLNLLQKEGGSLRKEVGKGGGVPTPEETMVGLVQGLTLKCLVFTKSSYIFKKTCSF